MARRVSGHTGSGQPIDDDLVDKLAQQAEAGYDVDHVVAGRARRGRPPLGSAPSMTTRWRRAVQPLSTWSRVWRAMTTKSESA